MAWLKWKREPFVEPVAPWSPAVSSGWMPVICPRTGRPSTALDQAAVTEFWRSGEDETRFYRLADQSPYFNVGGLYFRSRSG